MLKALLARPAPTPRVLNQAPVVPADMRPTDFFHRDHQPPDDAPIEDLLDYWQRWSENSDRDPSDTVRKRLFDACLENPLRLTNYLNFLPDADSTPRKVKELYDKALTDQQFDQSWRNKVREWLLYNSTYFLDELIALAKKAKDNNRDGDVDKQDAVTALASLSWPNAEPLLRDLMASGQPRATALALSLFYEHAVEEKDSATEERYRRDLQAIAANRQQPPYARDTAIYSLSSNEWSGRDEWYLGLFQDETLFDAGEGEYSLMSLHTLFSSDLEKWIPIMARLVDSKDMTVRSLAASCLLDVDDPKLARKALLPLLPWLTNPGWANDAAGGRMQLIQSLSDVDVPESVPGLISIIETDDPEQSTGRGFAAHALARYQDARAVPALKKALTKDRDEGNRTRIIQALLSSNGMSEMEQVAALEEYATKTTIPEARDDVMRYRGPQEEPLSPTLSIGKYLGQSRESPAEPFVNAVLVRAEELKSDKPEVAAALIEITHQWQGRQVELDIVRRIANGSADAPTIVEALTRRDKMLPGLRVELEGLSSVAGAAQAVGAVVLENSALAQGILNSEDEPAQIALLACARLMQTSLPVEMIGPFLRHKNELLARAAEAYLLAEDSREARELLWQRHPNEAFITGWREAIFGGSSPIEFLVKSEEKLRAELLKENGPVEIVAMVSNVLDQGLFLRIYPDKAIYSEHEDAARYRERTVPKAEVAMLKDYLAVAGFAERGPNIQWCHHGCASFELLMLTKEKGRRVFTLGGFDELEKLRELFVQLAAGDGAKIHYKLEEEIKGLEVLYAGELAVVDVAQQGGALRVFVERGETKEESEERLASYDYDGDDDDAERLDRIRRRLEIETGRYSWRDFANGQLGAITSQPDFYATFEPAKFVVADDENGSNWENGTMHDAQVVGPGSIVIARNFEGLWRQFAGTKPVRLGDEEASYSKATATRDGKWLVLSKTETDDGSGAYIVRLNLQTGREYRVDLPNADSISPFAALPGTNKVVLRRGRDEYVAPGAKRGPDHAEYFLLDAATGVVSVVTGNFTPLRQRGTRFLQPTEKPDEYWATIFDEEKNHTKIGRYSTKDFSFKPVMIVPQIIFDSMSMWVDASKAKVYVAYSGQLLRLPLQANAK